MYEAKYQPKQKSKITLNPYELMLMIENDQKVRINDFEIPFFPDFILYDISIDAKGGDEDKVYLKNEQYRKNIRRGNTIIQELDQKKGAKQTFWGRRGAEKFFDLNKEYIQQNLGIIKDFSSFGVKDISEHYESSKIIFQQAKLALDQSYQVQIFKLIKENGENAQISYIKQLKSWIIASKNVSLVAQNEQDIEKYKLSRFQFAKLIAQQWFKIIQRVQQNYGQDTISQLQNFLDGHTMVGEYCGDQNHQHLVKYESIDIRFFNIVSHQSEDSCIPPLEAEKYFKKFGLTYVKPVSIGIFKDWISLNQNLNQIYDQSEQSSIEDGQEGSVIYIVRQGQSTQEQDRVLSLCKLKTLEYRIYRKLREKLKQCQSNPKNKNNLYEKFINETKDLCKHNQPSKELSYYFNIAKISFDIVSQFELQFKMLQENYINFLTVVLNSQANNKIVNPKTDFEQQYISSISSIPWSSYYAQVLPQIQQQIQQKAPQIQKQEEQKNDQNLEIKQIQIQKDQQVQKVKKLTVIVPVGIPGMGKTTFIKNLKDIMQDVFVISSDEIRQKEMDILMKTNTLLSQQLAFEKSQQSAKKQFNLQLENLIKQEIPQKAVSSHALLFIDKNHPPNAFNSCIQLLKNCGQNFQELNIVALIPQCDNPHVINQTIKYPFSLSFFISCLQRVQQRKDHPTLNGSGIQSCGVVLQFFNMFRNQILEDLVIERGFNSFLKYPFTQENIKNEEQISKDLISKFNAVLIGTPPDAKFEKSILVQAFLKVFDQQQIIIDQVNEQQQKQLIKQFVEKNQLLNNQQQQQIDIKKNISSNIVQQLEEKKIELIPVIEKQLIKVQEKEIQNNNQKQTQSSQQQNDKLLKQNNNLFNPPEAPIYLGIFVKDEDQSKKQIENYIKQNLQKLSTEFTEFQPKIQQDIDKLLNNYKWPSGLHHITSCYAGGKAQQSIYYNNFQENIEIPIELYALVYVPDFIITSVCFVNQKLIDIQNACPHCTLMLGQWSAEKSNDLLQAIFTNQDSPLFNYYQLLQDQQSTAIFYKKIKIPEQAMPFDTFIIKPQKKLSFQGITKAIFKDKIAQKQNQKQQNDNEYYKSKDQKQKGKKKNYSNDKDDDYYEDRNQYKGNFKIVYEKKD